MKIQYYTAKEVCEKARIKKSCLYARTSTGQAPPPVVKQPRLVRYLASEIEEWLGAGMPNWKEFKGGAT